MIALSKAIIDKIAYLYIIKFIILYSSYSTEQYTYISNFRHF